MREEIRRTDPQTGERFIAKRANQKFARPENRIKYNNDASNALRKEREYINKPIHIAHVKLVKLMDGKNKTEFPIDFLKGYGVDFTVFNHFVLYDGIQCPAIFEFVFIIDKVNRKVKVIRHGRF